MLRPGSQGGSWSLYLLLVLVGLIGSALMFGSLVVTVTGPSEIALTDALPQLLR